MAVWESRRMGRWVSQHRDWLHQESKSCFSLFWLDKYLWVHYEVTPTDVGWEDSRSLFSSFSSLPCCSPCTLPTLTTPHPTPPPPSWVFNIKVCCLTGQSLKQGPFCGFSLRPARYDKNFLTVVQLRRQKKRTALTQYYNWGWSGVWLWIWNLQNELLINIYLFIYVQTFMVNSLYQTWSNRNEVMLSQFRSKQHTVHGALLHVLGASKAIWGYR